MDQMVLVLAIALLVWVGAGIGRHARPTQRNAFAGQNGRRDSEETQPSEGAATRSG